MSAIAYVVEAIKYAVLKKKAAEGEEVEKPTWNVSIVAIVVSLLFVVYFFVPAAL